MMRQAQTAASNRGPALAPLTRTRGRAVQRKCACGGSAGGAAECEACDDKNKKGLQRYSADRESLAGLERRLGAAGAVPPQDSPTGSSVVTGHDFGRVQVHAGAAARKVQKKSEFGEPADRYEQEADRIAQWVAGLHGSSHVAPAPHTSTFGSIPPVIQRAPLDRAGSNKPPGAAATGAATTPDRGPAPAGLIVEDDAVQSAPGQMRKTEFLNQLESAVCAGADLELAKVGRTAQGCPYIRTGLGYYRKRSSQEIERALFRYAPEAAGSSSAHDYIPILAGRITRAVAVWVATGRIAGIPEELARQFSAGGLLGAAIGVLSGIGGAVAGAIGSIGRTIGGLFTKAVPGLPTKEADPQQVQARLGSGQGLDSSVKSRMEQAMGHDFSSVRVHTDSRAAELSSDLNARAFTVGTDVAFAAGEYRPGTLIGDALLAHELAHVVQQAGGINSAAPMPKSGSQHDSFEEDADLSAVGAVTSIWGGASGALKAVNQRATPHLRSGLGLQRCHHAAPAARPVTPTKSQAVPGQTQPQTGPEATEQGAPAAKEEAKEDLTPVAPPPNCPNHTWADYKGGEPTGSFPAATGFHLDMVTEPGKKIVKAIFEAQNSQVDAKHAKPTDVDATGCAHHIDTCTKFIQKGKDLTFHIDPPFGPTCPAAIVPDQNVEATDVPTCTSVLGKECLRAAKAESERLLRHEQGHFTIGCVVAKKATDAIAAHPDQADAILEAAKTKADDLSSDSGPYDSQTDHGCDPTKQDLWERRIQAGLPSVTVP